MGIGFEDFPFFLSFLFLHSFSFSVIFSRYYTHKDAEACMKYINGTKVDGRPIKTDFDLGFKVGRQFGRGKTGGQVRDDLQAAASEGNRGWGSRHERDSAGSTSIQYPTVFDKKTRGQRIRERDLDSDDEEGRKRLRSEMTGGGGGGGSAMEEDDDGGKPGRRTRSSRGKERDSDEDE